MRQVMAIMRGTVIDAAAKQLTCRNRKPVEWNETRPSIHTCRKSRPKWTLAIAYACNWLPSGQVLDPSRQNAPKWSTHFGTEQIQ